MSSPFDTVQNAGKIAKRTLVKSDCSTIHLAIFFLLVSSDRNLLVYFEPIRKFATFDRFSCKFLS